MGDGDEKVADLDVLLRESELRYTFDAEFHARVERAVLGVCSRRPDEEAIYTRNLMRQAVALALVIEMAPYEPSPSGRPTEGDVR